MLVSLNVAINSYDYTLLSLLISNQFVEIKGCKSGSSRVSNDDFILIGSRLQEVRKGEPVPNHVCGYVLSRHAAC
jgi:hypothetical protein